MDDIKDIIADHTETTATTAAEDAKALIDEYLAGWKRAMADYANLKRETEKAREEFSRYAAASIIADLLPVMDNLMTALARQPKASPADPPMSMQFVKWSEGIGHVAAQFEKVMSAAGVVAIAETGMPFDPMRHEAMLSETREGIAPGTVLKILETGYALHDKVLRPAKVLVAD